MWQEGLGFGVWIRKCIVFGAVTLVLSIPTCPRRVPVEPPEFDLMENGGCRHDPPSHRQLAASASRLLSLFHFCWMYLATADGMLRGV